MRLNGLLALLALPIASVAVAQRPPVADPAYAYLVEGHVLDSQGRPIRGAVLERVRDARSTEPYSRGAYRETTDAQGAFRFHFSGLGRSTGRTWHLAVRAAGCLGRVVTVRLQRGRVPPHGREGDVARDVVIRLTGCRQPSP